MGSKDGKTGQMNKRIIFGASFMLAAITVVLIFVVIVSSGDFAKTVESQVYDRYYVMIADGADTPLRRSVYEACRAAAEKENACVEMLSDTLAQDYSVPELMKIAIASSVDGIILAAGSNEETEKMIALAAEEKIPVVTVLSDMADSERLSFVGMSNYNLGKEYGNLVLKLVSQKKSTEKVSVAVLMDAGSENSGQNVLFSALKSTVSENLGLRDAPVEISMAAVDSTNSFSVEESVRKLFLDTSVSLPDIIVCLNETDTTSVYQTVVEFNMVGRISILGFYDSEAILKGISRGVIYATLSADSEKIGGFCINALTEYYELGNTSQYFTTDIFVITESNLETYRGEAQDEQ